MQGLAVVSPAELAVNYTASVMSSGRRTGDRAAVVCFRVVLSPAACADTDPSESGGGRGGRERRKISRRPPGTDWKRVMALAAFPVPLRCCGFRNPFSLPPSRGFVVNGPLCLKIRNVSISFYLLF